MEITFTKTICPCLRKAVCQTQTQEQTQEVRLSDAMPDIGRVLGSWGQVLIRSKEWRGSGMSVSGGVMAWVLYAPEDGSHPQSVEAWIPFQMRWEFPQTQTDGTISVLPLLKAVDARSTSARKLMVRANVSLLSEALEPTEIEVAMPDAVPEDLQLLKVTYPMDLPQEASEKLFQLDEELVLQGSYPEIQRLLRYELQPQILEQKVMAGRLVFRGKCFLHVLFIGADDQLYTWDTELPFSQYAELDRDYGANASSMIVPMVTNLELIADVQQRLQLKCAMAAQYRICDRVLVEIAEDAYSPVRQVKLQQETLKMPVRLDQQEQMLQMSGVWNGEVEQVLDVACSMDQPQHQQDGNMAQLIVPMQFQLLYKDLEGNIQGGMIRCEQNLSLVSDSHNRIDAYLRADGWPQGIVGGQGVQLTMQCQIIADIFAEQGLPMVVGITAGEACEPDSGRPSLILRRKGQDRLWDIARACGSTVDAIYKANGLQEEPEEQRLLLIPVS